MHEPLPLYSAVPFLIFRNRKVLSVSKRLDVVDTSLCGCTEVVRLKILASAD